MSSKKSLSLLLALTVLVSTIFSGTAITAAAAEPGTPYNANGDYDVSVPHVLINQVWGGSNVSTTSDTMISNGFIELYNPTNSPIDMSGWSIWYADRTATVSQCTAVTDAWVQLPLTGTIEANSYYVIVGGKYATSNPKVNIDGKGDQSWPSEYFNNKGLKVLLVSNQSTTPPATNPFVSKPDNYVDMVGVACNETGSTIDGHEGINYPTGKDFGQSKPKSVRRINLSDTDNNGTDFEQIDYDKSSAEVIAVKGPHVKATFSITTPSLPSAAVDASYSTTLAVYGGTAPFTFSSANLPDGLQLNSVTGSVYGTPTADTVGTISIDFTVTDSSSPALTANKTLSLKISPAVIIYNDPLDIAKIGSYSVGTTSADGGVAEIVKYNKDNGKFYLVNGSAQPPTLDIVSLTSNETLMKDKSLDVKSLSETDGFVYGDLTSVDINTKTKRVSVSVQALEYNTPGKILVLDYEGNLINEYPAGIQPDMIKSTPDGKYIMTADEGEARMGNGAGTVDPEGSITIVDTVNDSVTHVKFDNESVIADDVHIRSASVDEEGQIVSSGTKADAIRDFEPEYIALSGDYSKAFVSLQENNAIATIDIASKTVLSVKSLGFKDYNDPNNALDLVKNGTINLENVPFKGVYMPDGIATYSIGSKNYILTANEGDATEWPAEDSSRINVTKISSVKGLLDPNSAAATFLNGKGTTYDKAEVLTDMGNDGIYLLGGRSFSIWDADSLSQVFDSGNEFEKITAERLPEFFNSGHDELEIDGRSAKKGPEPEDVKTGKVGNKTFAFVGLERVGGIMTYDVTNPANATFANYINTRILDSEDEDIAMGTDTGPEGIEFIPAADSPTGQPLLLVAFEVSGTVAVYQINATKVALDKTTISTQVGSAATKIIATVTPAGGSAATVTWSSSNTAIATVDMNGNVTPVAAGTATITALSADELGEAQAIVTVAAAQYSGGIIGGNTGGTDVPKPPVSSGNETKVTVETKTTADASGKAEATFTDKQITDSLEALNKAATDGKTAVLELKAIVTGDAKEAIVHFSADSLAKIAGSKASVTIDAVVGTISFDQTSIATVSAVTGDVSVSVKKLEATASGRPVYDFTVTAGGKTVSDFGGGTVEVNLPYTPAANEDIHAIVIYYVSDSGETIVVPNSVYDPATGKVTFKVQHFSNYSIGYHKLVFGDTGSSFAEDYITYLAAREIIGGIGDNKFAPADKMTRADITVILARMAEADLSSYSVSSFVDVGSSAYYSKSIEWAVERGIAGGIGNGLFNPKAFVTREQLVTMIARYGTVMKFDLPNTAGSVTFVDQNKIPSYALSSVVAVQQAGIIGGKTLPGQSGLFFAPKDYATRAETAKILAILMQTILK